MFEHKKIFEQNKIQGPTGKYRQRRAIARTTFKVNKIAHEQKIFEDPETITKSNK